MRRTLLTALCAAALSTIAGAFASGSSAAGYGSASWGWNGLGQLGDGVSAGPDLCQTRQPCSARPVHVSGLSEVGSVSAGGRHALAVLTDGTVLAWGDNERGQLGDGTTTGPESCVYPGGSAPCSTTPVQVSGVSGASAVAGGYRHSLALLDDGTVLAWGANEHGQLGDGATIDSDVPVTVSGLSGVTALAAGAGHSLALRADGTVMAWGANAEGQLGDGGHADSDVPVAVSGLSGVSAIAAGADFSVALLSTGKVMIWGRILSGEGTNDQSSDVPVEVSGLSSVSAIAAGHDFRLALLADGEVMAWGENNSGQLGVGTRAGPTYCGVDEPCSPVPVAVSGISSATAVAAGYEHALALLSDGTVMAWGSSETGELGNGTYVWPTDYFCDTCEATPVPVCGLSEASGISAGEGFSLAYGIDGAGTPCPRRPAVIELQPNEGPAAGGTSVTIGGDNFTGATGVKFGSADASSFIVGSDHTITATSPPGTPGNMVDVSVTTPEGTSPPPEGDFAFDAGSLFTYESAPEEDLRPSVTSVAPSAGPQGGGTQVTITGTEFRNVTSVRFGTSSAQSFQVSSSTSIEAISPPGTGTVDVVVSTVNGTSPSAGADRFSYAPPPIVTGRSPAKGPVTGGTSVTISGSNLGGATAVHFGQLSAASFTATSSSITAVSPSSSVVGPVDITVTTAGGTSARSSFDRFKYAPAITGLAPSAGTTAGGTSVEVTGAGFALGSTATTFKFGSSQATSVNCFSTTACTVVAPAHAAARVAVKAIVSKVSSVQSPLDRFRYG